MKKKTKKNKNYIPKTKNSSSAKSLKQKLHDIYYGAANLDSTCKGNLTCCRTACPMMNFSEFSQLINEVWDSSSKSKKIELICTSIEYFFRNEFEKWSKDSLIKPCLLLNDNGKCSYYSSRPLSCRIYGFWPEATYNARVDKFEKAYKGLLTREELPLNKQCPYVKRVDESIPLTDEIINGLYKQLDELDKKVGNFSDLQIEQKENYRTFHDWLLLKIFGEVWLANLTQFMLSASKPVIKDQIIAIKNAIKQKFAKEMPNIKLGE